MLYKNTVEVEPLVAKHLRKFCEAKQPKDDIFDKIHASKLNDYMKESMESLSAKVFRTYNASYTLQTELNKGSIDADRDTTESKVKFYDDCNRKVAILCNHQKTVAKSHEAQIQKMSDKLKLKQDQLKELLKWLRKLKTTDKELKGESSLSNSTMPKTE